MSGWRNGNAAACKTALSEFDSHPRFQISEQLMLWRVHPRTVNPIPLGKHSWFDSKLLHQIRLLLSLKRRLISERDPVAENR